MTTTNKLLLALKARYQAQKAEGIANIEVYMNHPAGIGDHSDIASAVAVEIAKIAAADDGLLVLEENFSDHIYSE